MVGCLRHIVGREKYGMWEVEEQYHSLYADFLLLWRSWWVMWLFLVERQGLGRWMPYYSESILSRDDSGGDSIDRESYD